MSDSISRRAAIDAANRADYTGLTVEDVKKVTDEVVKELKQLPSAQPEIIHCWECKYSDENWRRVSFKWLPCMNIQVPSNWFCGSAERREE